jgi:hypothetical protein
MQFFKKIFSLLLITFSTLGFSQEISGVVFDKRTNEPLEGASVYFDNTTIGTTTNSKGEFILDFNESIETSLVISFVGHESILITDFSQIENLKYFSKESSNVLPEVFLTSTSEWPRELKLKEFRKNYLGETPNGLASKILNEEDLILRYNKKKKQLTAIANSPIIVKNTNLKYLVTIDLQHFEINYSYVSKNKKSLDVKDVYYLGNNYYKSLEEISSKNTLKKRKKTYRGSPLHFMRALANEDLEREQYKIYRGNQPVASNEFITVTPIDNLGNVKVELKWKLNILFEGREQSYIKSSLSEFYIDKFGNHSPPKAVKFGGELGRKRIADALPLDYLIINQKEKD